jgi:hypothetical protein
MEKIIYSYRYTVTSCPECESDLTRDEAVCLTLVVAGCTLNLPTKLDKYGNLIDTEDGAVAAGFHSLTECANCGCSLEDYEEQIEEEYENQRTT